MANATPVTAASGGQTTPVIVVSSGPATPLENVLAQGTPIQVVTSGPATPVTYGGPQYDFTTGVLPAGMTFTRASQAWGFNSAGVLTQYATDAPRFVYDPVTFTSLGLLVEGARTNGLRNNTMVGAVVGNPGTGPTTWIKPAAANGVSNEVISIGIEDGIDYIDVRFFGTPSLTGATNYAFNTGTNMAALSGQIWTHATFVRLVGGSTANLATTLDISERDGAGAFLAGSNTPFAPTAAALRTQRIVHLRTLVNASTAFVNAQLSFGFTNALPINITLRIGLPQLEVGEVTAGTTTALLGSSSPIKTSTVAVARAADVARLTDARVFTDKAIIVRGRTAAALSTAALQQSFVNFDDGTGGNRKGIARTSGGNVFYTAITGSVSQINQTITSGFADNTDFAVAARFDLNNSAASLNGAAVLTDNTCTMPVVTACGVGGFPAAPTHAMFSTIKSIETRPTASDAELQALSVP